MNKKPKEALNKRFYTFKLPSSDYVDIAPVFQDIVSSVMIPPVDEDEFNVAVRTNLRDLESNRKPAGYLPPEESKNPRIIFPIKKSENDPIEFSLIYSHYRSLNDASYMVKQILNRAGIEHRMYMGKDYVKEAGKDVKTNENSGLL